MAGVVVVWEVCGDEGKEKLPIILHKKQMLYVVMLEETMQVIPLFMVVRNLFKINTIRYFLWA